MVEPLGPGTLINLGRQCATVDPREPRTSPPLPFSYLVTVKDNGSGRQAAQGVYHGPWVWTEAHKDTGRGLTGGTLVPVTPSRPHGGGRE